jgi:hypothetical protein
MTAIREINFELFSGVGVELSVMIVNFCENELIVDSVLIATVESWGVK